MRPDSGGRPLPLSPLGGRAAVDPPQGTAAEKLALFEKLKARGGFDGEDPRELREAENMLEMLAAMEKEGR
jgi:hypothetical protein